MTDAHRTSDQSNEPPVIGAGDGRAPMPTQADRRRAWRSLFIEAAIKAGIDDEHAAELFEAGSDDWDYSQKPEDALADEVQYWENDGG